jgi:uncharacterized protein
MALSRRRVSSRLAAVAVGSTTATSALPTRNTTMSRLIALSIVAIAVQAGIATAQPTGHSHHGSFATPPVRPPATTGETTPLPARVQFGDPVAFGRGTIRTLVAFNADGRPASVGVSFSASALEGLPAQAPADDLGWLFRLPLPSGVALPPYDHVAVYWNPHGHEPHGVYDVAHIDVHFFLTPPEEVDRITASDRDLELCYRLPPAQAIPAGYILPPGTQHRRMGVHWIEAEASEFKGQPFTATFIVGSYDRQVNFLEPMIAHSFLASRPNLRKPVAQPEMFARSGWYPSTWVVRWDEQRAEYLVLLDGLMWKESAVRSTMPTASPRR